MQLLSDNASSTLVNGIGPTSTSIQVSAGEGANFPNPKNGDFFLATLFKRVGVTEFGWEVVLCNSRAGDVMTVVRGQNGTGAATFNPGDFIELRLVADTVLPVRNGALTGALNEAAPVSMASAASMPIGAAGANTISVTGNNPITSFDVIAPGAVRRMTFTGILTLTHNAVSLRLLAGANITTAAEDWCEWLSLGAGNWKMVSYTRANGGSLVADATKASLSANTFTGAQSYMGVDKGTVGTGTVTFAFSAGNAQRLQVNGALTIALSGFPAAGITGDMLIKLVNGGVAAVTLPTINWILPATGAPAASFAAYLAAIGRTALQTAGTDFMYLWTDDAGATVYGKLL